MVSAVEAALEEAVGVAPVAEEVVREEGDEDAVVAEGEVVVAVEEEVAEEVETTHSQS